MHVSLLETTERLGMGVVYVPIHYVSKSDTFNFICKIGLRNIIQRKIMFSC